MRRSFLLVALSLVLCLPLHAQQASIEFITEYTASILRIAPSIQANNGASIPVMFNPTYSRDSVLDGAVITSTPIAVANHQSLSMDLRSATTIIQDDPVASKGVLRADVEIVDTETGAVLWSRTGLDIFMESTKPGRDTTASRHLKIDFSTMHAYVIILRVTGMCMFGHIPAPRVSIDNTLSKEVDQVR